MLGEKDLQSCTCGLFHKPLGGTSCYLSHFSSCVKAKLSVTKPTYSVSHISKCSKQLFLRGRALRWSPQALPCCELSQVWAFPADRLFHVTPHR